MRADDAKIVRSRHAQCNTEEAFVDDEQTFQPRSQGLLSSRDVAETSFPGPSLGGLYHAIFLFRFLLFLFACLACGWNLSLIPCHPKVLLHDFFGLPFLLAPWGFHSRDRWVMLVAGSRSVGAPFPSLYGKSLLVRYGHNSSLMIFLGHRLVKVWSWSIIFFVSLQVSDPTSS